MVLQKIFNMMQRETLTEKIKQEVHFSFQYIALLVLSAIVATLGLIINNAPIIIGAMLISPMIWPIIGIALGTVRKKKHLMKNSVVLLTFSIVVSIGLSYLVGFVSPITSLGSEILSRTNPTIFDLLIALTAGTAATLILLWPKYSSSLAGVAIAASLIPPICTTGIGLSIGDMSVAYGSFILFLTNLASIIFVGIIIFALARFHKGDSTSDEDDIKRIGFGIILSFGILLILGIQLVFSLRQILHEDTLKSQARLTLNQHFSEISQDIKLDTMVIRGAEFDQDELTVEADIKVPAETIITIDQKKNMIADLSESLGKDTNLVLRITQIVEAFQPNEDQKVQEQRRQKIESILKAKTVKISENIEIQSLQVSDLEPDNIVLIDTVWRIPESVVVTEQDKQDINLALGQNLKQKVSLKISLVKYYNIQPNKLTDAYEVTRDDLQSVIAEYLEGVEEIGVEKLTVNLNEGVFVINLDISVSNAQAPAVQNAITEVKEYIQNRIEGSTIEWNIKAFEYNLL